MSAHHYSFQWSSIICRFRRGPRPMHQLTCIHEGRRLDALAQHKRIIPSFVNPNHSSSAVFSWGQVRSWTRRRDSRRNRISFKFAQPGCQCDAGGEPQYLSGPGRISSGPLDVYRPPGLKDRIEARQELPLQGRGKVVYRDLAARTDIENPGQRPRVASCDHIGARPVADMDEIAGLPAVAEYHQRLACPQPDRTSTRLNSSHLVMSYRVFC